MKTLPHRVYRRPAALVGSLFGIGLVNGTARRKTILAILLAWVTTLPVAAVLGALAYAVLRLVGV